MNKKELNLSEILMSQSGAGVSSVIEKIRLGEQGDQDAKSGFRQDYNMDDPVKINLSILIFERIRQGILGAFSAGDGRLYVEIGNCACLVDGTSVKYSGEPYQANTVLAYFLKECLKDKGKLRESFLNCVRELQGAGISRYSASLFCDSIYYSQNNGTYNITVSDDLTLSEIQAALNTGLLINAIPGIGTDQPRLAKKSELPEDRPEPKQKRQKSSNKSANAILFEEIKRGEHIIPYEWHESVKGKIKPLSSLETYVPNENFFKMFRKIEFFLKLALREMQQGIPPEQILEDTALQYELQGPPGTGKSRLLSALSASLGLPFSMENGSRNTEESDFTGKHRFVTEGDKTEIRQVSTEVLEGFRYGGLSVCEESHLMRGAIKQGVFSQVLESPFVILEQGYKPLQRHPLSVFVSTVNPGVVGAFESNQAFDSRVETVVFGEPDKKSFIEALVKRTGVKRAICSWVYNRYAHVVELLKSESFLSPNTESILMKLSIRMCVACIRTIQVGYCSPVEAFHDAVINKIDDEELKAQIEVAISNDPELLIEEGMDIYD